jgi:PKD repeat protein
MKRSPHRTLSVALSLILICTLIVPFVSAVPTTVTATVPPVLQACSQATYPEANFTCSYPGDLSGIIPDGPPYTIRCTDNSSVDSNQSIVSWKWDFGDGGTSNDRNPQHAYSEPSSYDIRLTVTTFCGEHYSNKTVGSLSIYCNVPEPGFTPNVTEGYAPLAVVVTDSSRNTREDITRWTYWFDNAHVSHERNPVFIYTTPGTYTINQTVWKDCVQLGSSLHPPATQQITVKAPLTVSSLVNETNVSLATTVTGAAPVATISPVTPAVSAPIAVTDTVQNEAAIPGTGTLSVSTEPAGAQVYIDDVFHGTSPATVPDLPSGSHTLRFEREGYQNMSMPVSITGGQTTTFSTSLLPEAAGSSGIAILPVIALVLIILGVVGMGIYLYRTQPRE